MPEPPAQLAGVVARQGSPNPWQVAAFTCSLTLCWECCRATVRVGADLPGKVVESMAVAVEGHR